MKQPVTILLALNWFDPRIYRGVYLYCSEQGWHLSPHLYTNRLYIPRGWEGSGIIFSHGPALAEFVDSLTMPAVDISFKGTKNTPKVLVDNRAISEMAAEHFLERGYRYFACYIQEQVSINVFRNRAFRDALLARGVPEENIFRIIHPEGGDSFDWLGCQRSIVSRLEELPRPLAVYTAQDNLGASLVEVCHLNGVRVPEDVAVVGVDNIDTLCTCLPVPLSSVDPQLELLGYEAAKQLGRLMKGDIRIDEPTLFIPPLEVVTRQSTDILSIEHPGITKALSFIHEHFSEAVTIDDVAHVAGMSKRGIEKAFDKALGRSPFSELKRVRMDFVKQQLEETDTKISQIAVKSGFGAGSNLALAFKKHFGMTPQEYRNRVRWRQ